MLLGEVHATCVGKALKPKVKNTAAFAMTEDSELGCEGKNLPEGPILSPRSLQAQLCSLLEGSSKRAGIDVL